MDISISKTADGRNRKFIGGQWFPLSKDDRTAKLQTMALLTQWAQLKDTGVRVWPATVLADKQTFVISLVATASIVAAAPAPMMPPASSCCGRQRGRFGRQLPRRWYNMIGSW